MNSISYKKGIAVLLFSIFYLNVFSQSGPTVRGNHARENLVKNKRWQLVKNLSDEFNGNSLSSKWDPRPVVPGLFNWVGRWPVLFEEQNVRFYQGELWLESKKFNSPKRDRNGSRNDWTHGGAIIRSKAKAQVGMYMEASMRANESFLGGGFWMITPAADCKKVPKQELDITECLGLRTFKTRQPKLSWYDGTAFKFANGMNPTLRQRKTACLPTKNRSKFYGRFDPSKGFYTYGVYWETANRVHWYLNGRYKGTTNPSIPFRNGMVINLSCEGYDFNFPTGNDVTDGFKLRNGKKASLWSRSMKFKWVRTWRVRGSSKVAEDKSAQSTESSPIRIHPNPTSNKVIYIDGLTTGEKVNVKVIAVNGQVVQNTSFISNISNEITLNDRLPSGMYFLKINSEKVKLTEKIIVQ